jgi:prostaglandin-endoperoxide synthase 2
MFEGIPRWLLKLIISLANNWQWLGKTINRLAINRAVNVAPHRPHPWSTVHDYVSWTSLSDQHWSARHRQAVYLTDLPDPDRVKALFKRATGEQRYCEKSTCVFSAFAQYLTDGFIRTRMPNKSAGETDDLRRQNTSNHQIDLCPLYGRTAEQTAALRLKSETTGQRGRLKSQSIGGEEYAPYLYEQDGQLKPEFAILDVPLGIDRIPDPALRALFAFGGDRANASPQVAMINTLFLREHNRLTGEIETRNPQWDDERVFQTARNNLIVMFINIVVEEYINHISPTPFRLRADPAVAWNAPWNKPNWITTEFSLLYRWHSLIPDVMTWDGTPYPAGATNMDNRPLIKTGLARSFVELSAQRAGQLGAFNTADALLEIEKLAIMQGRLCHLAPYADYRAHVSLARPGDFDSISSDPRTGPLLRSLYGDPSRIDFYVGLFAEEPVKNSPLPPLLLAMVAVDAFSQALTNPLLSERVFNQETFTKFGWDEIHDTSSLGDIVRRNSPAAVGDARISMTRADWTYRW